MRKLLVVATGVLAAGIAGATSTKGRAIRGPLASDMSVSMKPGGSEATILYRGRSLGRYAVVRIDARGRHPQGLVDAVDGVVALAKPRERLRYFRGQGDGNLLEAAGRLGRDHVFVVRSSAGSPGKARLRLGAAEGRNFLIRFTHTSSGYQGVSNAPRQIASDDRVVSRGISAVSTQR